MIVFRILICGFLAVVTYGQAPEEEACFIDNCDGCQDFGPRCVSCGPQTVLNVERTACLSCGNDCGRCVRNILNDVQCINCNSGFYATEEYTCKACPYGCRTCDIDAESGFITCTTCHKGFALFDFECVGCTANCETCGLQDGFPICRKCSNEYYLHSETKTCELCPANAIVCEDRGDGDPRVLSCKPPYVVKLDLEDPKENQSVCLECPLQCASCSQEAISATRAKCSVCPPNRSMNEYFFCDLCDVDEPPYYKCAQCNATGCVACRPKYVLQNGNCEDCPWRCDDCGIDNNGDNQCNSCVEKYGFKNATAKVCEECRGNCGVCTISNTDLRTCEQCMPGYTFLTDLRTCTACPENCECAFSYRANQVSCTECHDGFAYFQPSNPAVVRLCKHECRARCTSCAYQGTPSTVDDSIDCTACEEGYGLEVNSAGVRICLRIPLRCVSLAVDEAADSDSKAKCAECEDGSYLKADFTCAVCAAGCAECDTDTSTDNCDACADGYADKDGDASNGYDCVACTVANCKSCDVTLTENGQNVQTTTCTQCADRYAETLTDPRACRECPKDCAICENVAEVGLLCRVCDPGFTINFEEDGTTKGTCGKCPDNCDQCTGTDKGTVCDSVRCSVGHAMDENMDCHPCRGNCISCEFVGGENVCLSCEENFAVLAGKCVECPRNCAVCTGDELKGETVCTVCAMGYAFNENPCAECPPRCLDCVENQGAMQCIQCEDRYALVNGFCEKCPSSCQECIDSSTCTKCEDGYARDIQQSCKRCSSLTFKECVECTDESKTIPSSCLECSTGFTLKDGLSSGPNAECVDAKFLKCGSGREIIDTPPKCPEGSCVNNTKRTEDNLCARSCVVCGDVFTDSFVSLQNCRAENKTEDCLIGVCYGKQQFNTKDEVIGVLSGCLPRDLNCTDTLLEEEKEGSCVSYNATSPEGAVGIDEECERCCYDEHDCNDWILEPWRVGAASKMAVASVIVVFVSMLCAVVEMVENL